MTDESSERAEHVDRTEQSPTLRRRTMLAATAGVTTAVAGLGAFGGTVLAWDRFVVDFKGCSEVWMIVGDDLDYSPPTVAHVIVETADGGTDCRLVEFTEETATTVAGQYGEAPLVKYTVEEGEKVLAVLQYSRSPEGRFDKPSCLIVNTHRCAQTPDTADLYASDCVQAAYDGHWDGTYWDSGSCAEKVVDGAGSSNDRGGPSGNRGRSSNRR